MNNVRFEVHVCGGDNALKINAPGVGNVFIPDMTFDDLKKFKAMIDAAVAAAEFVNAEVSDGNLSAIIEMEMMLRCDCMEIEERHHA